MNVESHRHQAVDHVLDLLFFRAFLHYDNHFNSCSLCELRSPTNIAVFSGQPEKKRIRARFRSAGVSPAGLAARGTTEKSPARRRRYENPSPLKAKARV